MEYNRIQSYLNHVISCPCGKEHSCNIREVEVKRGALMRLPEWIRKYGFQKPLFVYDETTYALAGERIAALMEKAGIQGDTYIIPFPEPVADTEVCALVGAAIREDTDLVVAVGSGTINDVCRYESHQKHVPYFIVGTAPSMDGYASNVSPLIVNNLKITYIAQIPMAIIGDSEFLTEAPMNMIAAGVGDILGKYTCLMDWKIANEVVGEYHCEMLHTLVQEAIKAVVSNLDGLKKRDEKAVEGVMEGLILSGIAMSFAGNSRPASGSEHHLSHYWEMMFLLEGKPPVFHGTKVGIGTVQVLRMYERLLNTSVDFGEARIKAKEFRREPWEEEMKKLYGPAAGEVIDLENKIQKNAPDQVLKRLDMIEAHWKKLCELMRTLPSSEEVAEMLRGLDAPAEPAEVGIGREHVRNAIVAAKELRDRFGLLQLLFDLGLIKEFAKEDSGVER